MRRHGYERLLPARLAFLIGLAASLALILLFSSKSDAAPFTPELSYAYELANEHWHGPPTGCTSIDFEIVPNGSIGDFEGEASEPLPGEAPKPCFLYVIARDAAPNWFERACAIIRHEDGHLHGFGHSDDPNSIMFPDPQFVPSQCASAGLFLLNHSNPRRQR
jgi:hypothetical protein